MHSVHELLLVSWNLEDASSLATIWPFYFLIKVCHSASDLRYSCFLTNISINIGHSGQKALSTVASQVIKMELLMVIVVLRGRWKGRQYLYGKECATLKCISAMFQRLYFLTPN